MEVKPCAAGPPGTGLAKVSPGARTYPVRSRFPEGNSTSASRYIGTRDIVARMITTSDSPIPALLISGSVGVGKTRTAFEISEILEARGVSHAYIDADLTYLYPEPAGEAGMLLDRRVLSEVWNTLRDAGAPRLILTRVIRSRAHLEEVRQTLPDTQISVFRLDAPLSVIAQRIGEREIGSGQEWHLKRARELLEGWSKEPVEDYLIGTQDRPVREIAEEILALCGW